MSEHIVTRCPSCGNQTLFIGSGGSLVCSWLKCREPGAINEAFKVRTVLADVSKQLSAAVGAIVEVTNAHDAYRRAAESVMNKAASELMFWVDNYTDEPEIVDHQIESVAVVQRIYRLKRDQLREEERPMEAEHMGAVEDDAPMDIKDSGEEAAKDDATAQAPETEQQVDSGGEE